MQGRFHVSPRYLQEINTDEFQEVIKDVVKPIAGREYPASIMLPPVSELMLKDGKGEWERYRIELFFLTTTFYTGGSQVKQPNHNTQTSTHSIQMDWHDMKRCAKDFILALQIVGDGKPLTEFPFRLLDEKKIFEPASMLGDKKLSGVRLTFKVDIWTGCEIEDYPDGSLNDVEIPELNFHPTHKH